MLVVNEKRLVKHRNSFSTVWTHSLGRHDRGEYIKVGSTENLSAPGVIFRYASYVREQEALRMSSSFLGNAVSSFFSTLVSSFYTITVSRFFNLR